jgi:hypothetical protein
MKALRCCFKPGFNHGKTSRMEGVAETWPTGQLVVGGALCSQFLLKLALEVCCPLPSPIRIFPAPSGFAAECIFNDHEAGPAIGTATSLPSPLAGEKP